MQKLWFVFGRWCKQTSFGHRRNLRIQRSTNRFLAGRAACKLEDLRLKISMKTSTSIAWGVKLWPSDPFLNLDLLLVMFSNLAKVSPVVGSFQVRIFDLPQEIRSEYWCPCCGSWQHRWLVFGLGWSIQASQRRAGCLAAYPQHSVSQFPAKFSDLKWPSMKTVAIVLGVVSLQLQRQGECKVWAQIEKMTK